MDGYVGLWGNKGSLSGSTIRHQYDKFLSEDENCQCMIMSSNLHRGSVCLDSYLFIHFVLIPIFIIGVLKKFRQKKKKMKISDRILLLFYLALISGNTHNKSYYVIGCVGGLPNLNKNSSFLWTITKVINIGYS